MKKSLSRLLALTLVLAVIVGMVPMVLADGKPTNPDASTLTVNAPSTIEVGKSSSVSVATFTTPSGANPTPDSFVLSSSSEHISISGNNITGVSAGSASVTATASWEGENYTNVGSTTFTVTVTEPAVTGGTITVSGAATVMVGTIVNLTASTTDPTAPEGYELTNISWNGAKADSVDKTKATVTSETAQEISVTATATFSKAGAEDVTRTSDAIKVKFVDKYTVSVDPSSPVTLKVGQEKAVTVGIAPNLSSAANVTMESADPKIVSVAGGKIKGIAVGTTKVIVTVSAGEGIALEGAGEDGKVKVEIPVTISGGAYIQCAGISVEVDSTDTLSPTAVGTPEGATSYVTFKTNSNHFTVDSATGKVTGKTQGIAKVTIEGYYIPKNGTAADKVALEACETYVSVYDTHTVKVALKSDVPTTFSFDETGLFSSAKYDSTVITTASATIKSLLNETDGYSITFSEDYLSDDIGTLKMGLFGNKDTLLLGSLSSASITLNGKAGTMILDYVIKSTDATGGLIIAKGELHITAGQQKADITYETGFNQAVELNENDFAVYYKSVNKNDTLDYVVFDIANDAPDRGTMYVNGTATSANLAKNSMSFFYKYSSTTDKGTYNYDLDTLTYVPSKYATEEYVDYVTFTCYGESKKTATGLLAFEVSEENPFTDVKEDMYYYDAVLWAVGEGITNGISDTKFGPDNACTRGQVVTFLWRAAGEPEPKSSFCKFTDVKANAYYYDAVLWAVEEGITDGMTATTFAPDAACTRAQVVTFLYRAFDEPSATSLNGFKDVPNNAYFYNPVVWAVKNGITNGQTKDTFAPNVTCTRGQIVTFLYRAFAD